MTVASLGSDGFVTWPDLVSELRVLAAMQASLTVVPSPHAAGRLTLIESEPLVVVELDGDQVLRLVPETFRGGWRTRFSDETPPSWTLDLDIAGQEPIQLQF